MNNSFYLAKPNQLAMKLVLTTTLLFISVYSISQEKTIYDVETLKIDEAVYDSVVQFGHIEPHLNGIGWLRKHVEENMADYPMEEEAIATSRNKQHEAHKRWERYMRTLPVKIFKIEDIKSAIEIKCSIQEKVSVCQDFQSTMVLTFENHCSQPINFEFALDYNSFILYPSDQSGLEKVNYSQENSNDSFNYVGDGRATISISPNQLITVSIPLNYSCDGKGGELYKSIFQDNLVQINCDLKLNGYTYNKEKKELYMLATSNIKLASLKLEY